MVECFASSDRYFKQIAEGGNDMKLILGAVTALSLLVGVAAAQPAEARCWMTPYGWHCWHPHPYGGWGWHHHHGPWGWR
jgi:hypothetical protein